MEINIHNYEEHFLSYADGELSAVDKKVVEQFVADNQGLEEEYKLALSCVLQPEEIKFTDTAFLLKEGTDDMQENLLLHLDDELDKTKADKLAAAISSELLLQKEWALLNKTKLLQESIILNDKSSLYKSEKGRVVSGGYWRMAAAAVVLGICMLAGYKYVNKTEQVEGNETAITKGASSLPSTNVVKIKKVTKNIQPGNDVAVLKTKSTEVPAPDKNFLTQKNTTDSRKVNHTDFEKTPEPAYAASKNNAPVKDPVLMEVNKRINKVTTPIPENTYASIDKELQPRKEIIDVDLAPRKANPALTAALNHQEENDNTKILYVDSKILKQTKAGAIFKKINDIIDRKNNIGNGKTLKIANFEIAL